MSRRLKYIFPAGADNDICLLQTVNTGNNFVFNGNVADRVLNQVSFISKGYSKSIRLSSTNDLSGMNFTIIGTQNGAFVTEVIVGPNNAIVPSVEIYDVITSIIPSGNAVNVTIGSGTIGFFPLIGINLAPEYNVINYTLSLARLTGTQVTTAVFGTVDNIGNNGRTYLDNMTTNLNVFPIRILTPTDNYIYSNTGNPTYSYLIVYIEQGDTRPPIQMNFTQI